MSQPYSGAMTPGSSPPQADAAARVEISTLRCVLVGVTGGLLSGLFGIGGGIVMVPLLVLWLGLDQKRAITTSLLAIIPIAIAGTLGYAVGGAVTWQFGLLLALGSIVGGQLGVAVLPRVPVPVLQIVFAVLLCYSAYRLVLPQEYGTGTEISAWWLFLIVGAVAGLLAALLGVGGGIILVPALVLLAGTDLDVARGTSLLVVIITALTATATNWRAGRVDVRIGIIAGLAGAPAALLGAVIGQWVPQQQAAILFAVLMVLAAVQMLQRAWRDRAGRRSAASDESA